MANLGKEVKQILIQAPLTSGTGTDPDSTVIDMQGFEGCLITAIIGNADSTGVITVKVQESSSSSGSWNDLSGITASTSAGESDVMLIYDVYKPKDRFLRVNVARTTGVAYGGTIATQYGALVKPTTHDSSTLGATMIFGVTPST